MNNVNLPLALFTVVLRRFIDKLRAPQAGAIVLKSTPWLIDTSLFKLCLYAYMFSTGLYYTIKHMRRGTIVSLAQKCSDGAVSIKDKCLRRKWLDRRRSWLTRNLTKNRETQQTALRYVASLVPPGRPNPRNSDINCPSVDDNDTNYEPPVNNQCGQARNAAIFNDQQESVFGSNPYFEPRVSYNRPNINRVTHQSTPHAAGELSHLRCTNLPPVRNSPYMNLSDEESLLDVVNNIEDSMKTKPKKRKRILPRLRNYISLRSRNINKNELNCANKLVRKTRSGKVYGYQSPPYRYKNRK